MSTATYAAAWAAWAAGGGRRGRRWRRGRRGGVAALAAGGARTPLTTRPRGTPPRGLRRRRLRSRHPLRGRRVIDVAAGAGRLSAELCARCDAVLPRRIPIPRIPGRVSDACGWRRLRCRRLRRLRRYAARSSSRAHARSSTSPRPAAARSSPSPRLRRLRAPPRRAAAPVQRDHSCTPTSLRRRSWTRRSPSASPLCWCRAACSPPYSPRAGCPPARAYARTAALSSTSGPSTPALRSPGCPLKGATRCSTGGGAERMSRPRLASPIASPLQHMQTRRPPWVASHACETIHPDSGLSVVS